VLADGQRVTLGLVESLLAEELDKIRDEVGAETFDSGRYRLAAELFADITRAEELADFLTLIAYPHLD
jgi:malate synthase